MSTENVKFGLASNRNVTFNYVDDSGWTREDWVSLSPQEQDQALTEYLYENVEVWVETEESDGYCDA